MEAAAQALVDALATSLGRGVSVDDPGGALLGFSAQHDDVDRARITSILTRQVPPAVAAWQEAHGIRTATTPVRVPANPGLGMDARVCAPLRHGGALVGQLWVVEKDRPLDDAELADVERTAARLAALLPTPARADGRPEADECLATVVEDDDPAAVARLHAVLGDVTVRPVVVRAARADREPGPGGPVRWAVPRSARVVAVHRGEQALTALVTGTDDLVVLLDAVRRSVGPATVTTVVGVGPRSPVPALGPGLRRADRAARAAAVDPALPSVVGWDDLGPYRDLFGDDDDDDDDLVALAAGGGSAADLLHTLETYLDLAGDAGRTAAALSLHRTSLYYRLGRIEKLLGVDLGDGRTRTHLHLGLKRRRLRRAE